MDEHLNEANEALDLTPQEGDLYKMHLMNLHGSGGVDNTDEQGNVTSRSSLYQATEQGPDGRWYNIPTVWGGKIETEKWTDPSTGKEHDIPNATALANVRKMGWDRFPSYNSPQEADERYMQMHHFMEKDTGDYFAQKAAGAGRGRFREALEAPDDFGRLNVSSDEDAAPTGGEHGIPSKFIEGIKQSEGFAPRAAWDYKQFTSGYGTRASYAGEPIDKETADKRFGAEISKAARFVDTVNPKLDSGTRAALTSLTFNAGEGWGKSALGDRVRAGDVEGARSIFLQYNRAGGTVNPGLVGRRAREASWFGQNEPSDPGQIGTVYQARPAAFEKSAADQAYETAKSFPYVSQLAKAGNFMRIGELSSAAQPSTNIETHKPMNIGMSEDEGDAWRQQMMKRQAQIVADLDEIRARAKKRAK